VTSIVLGAVPLAGSIPSQEPPRAWLAVHDCCRSPGLEMLSLRVSSRVLPTAAESLISLMEIVRVPAGGGLTNSSSRQVESDNAAATSNATVARRWIESDLTALRMRTK